MSIAPKNLMSELRFMPDAELASFARTHMNDPMIFPLVFQESQDRQRLRAAKQAQAAGAAQPKVAQQNLQQIEQQAAPQMAAAQLPENVGIGQLPAPNLETVHKAAGGIIAFGDGGEVPGYAERGLVTTAPSAGTEYGIPGLAVGQSFSPQAGQPDLTWLQRKRQETVDKMSKGLPVTPQERMMVSMFGSGAPTAPVAGNAAAVNAVQPSQISAADQATQDRGAQILSAMRDQGAAQGDQKTQAAPQPDGGIASLFGGQGAGGAGAPSTGGFMGNLEKILGKPETVPTEAETAAKLEGIQKPFFESITKKIEDQRGKLKSDREDAVYMSMIKGGFRAAAGKSPYALSNIAEGGEAGAADFGESLKDLRKAAQEQSKMELELDKAKMDASTGNLKTAWDRTDKANQHNMERNKALATGYTTLTDAAMRTSATVAAANAIPAQYRVAYSLGSGDTPQERLTSGLAALTKATGDKPEISMMKLYSDYAAKMQQSGQQPDPAAFARDMRAYLAFANPKVTGDASGNVRARP